MKTYLVGGAVRDRLLGLPVRDRDWVVVGATESEMLDRGFARADADFPVFLHPDTGEEYALARRETKTAPGYKGFRIDAGPDVTLEQDLQRRDLTINAMAEDESGNLIDPWGGRSDLDAGMLRHISPAFAEDPVRLLRAARFAARLGRWGFRLSHGTHRLMKSMAVSGELETLGGERVWQEMKQALAEEQPWRFFQVLQNCGVLVRLNPALSRVLGGDGTHAGGRDCTMVSALKRAVKPGVDQKVRFAVAFYHAAEAAGGAVKAVAGLKVEKEFLEQLKLTLRMAPAYRSATANPQRMLDLIEGTRALQSASRLKDFLAAADALWPGLVGTSATVLRALDRVAAITPASLQRRGLAGAALGEALRQERLRMIGALAGGPGTPAGAG